MTNIATCVYSVYVKCSTSEVLERKDNYFPRQQKEIMKANETAEEKRARRQLKKEAKQRRLRERMGWDQEMMVREGD